MQITYRDLKDLTVETENGKHLGKVVDLVLDNERHAVLKYEVRSRVLKNTLLIDSSQVVAITRDKIIVQDELTREPVLASSM